MARVDLFLQEDEEFRLRAMQGISPVYSPSLVPQLETPKGLSQLSSIGKADEVEASSSQRPVLDQPNIMLAVIGAHAKTEELAAKSANLFEIDISHSRAELDRLAAEKQQALENEAKSIQSRSTWSALSNVAQYISSAGLIALGYSVGGWSGAVLAASGVIGMGDRIIHDTHFLETAAAWYSKSEELQSKFTHNIEMGLFYTQLGLGLAGGIAAWKSGALAAAHINRETVKTHLPSIMGAAGQVTSIGSRIGASYHDKKIAHLQADLKEIETKMFIDKHEMHQESLQLTKMIESAQAQTDETRKAIQALQISVEG